MTDKIEEQLEAEIALMAECGDDRRFVLREALSALRTQRDEVIEECAQLAAKYSRVAGEMRTQNAVSGDATAEWFYAGAEKGGKELATAIRNLKSDGTTFSVLSEAEAKAMRDSIRVRLPARNLKSQDEPR